MWQLASFWMTIERSLAKYIKKLLYCTVNIILL
jgi:hypothetical protein